MSRMLTITYPRFLACLALTALVTSSVTYTVVNNEPQKQETAEAEEPAFSPLPYVPKDSHAEFTFDNVLIRLNEARLAEGLEQLGTDAYLAEAAQKDLVGNCPVGSHESFRSQHKAGVFRKYKQVGEALNSGFTTPKESIEGFLSSPTHKDAILSPEFTRVGIAVVTDSDNCVALILGR